MGTLELGAVGAWPYLADPPMDVATIIVNYRTSAATIEAVTALLPDLDAFDSPLVVVVDNASGDGSLDSLRRTFAEDRWRDRVVVVDGEYNRGFGGGVNAGVRYVRQKYGAPKYSYILNPDASIEPGALRGLVAFMEEHPDAGLVGNLVQNRDADQVGAFRFPTLLSELEGTACLGPVTRLLRDYVVPIQPTETCEVDWVSGVSMLFRSAVFDTVGLFDEGFFLYFEEIDLAKRVHDAGWKVYFVAGVRVDHVGGLSTGFKDESRRMPKYWFESRRRYFVKHHGRVYAAGCDAAWICGHAMYKLKQTVRRSLPAGRPSFGRDFLRYSVQNFLRPAPEHKPAAGPAPSPWTGDGQTPRAAHG
jgi:GT2 family glycosyltransferase